MPLIQAILAEDLADADDLPSSDASDEEFVPADEDVRRHSGSRRLSSQRPTRAIVVEDSDDDDGDSAAPVALGAAAAPGSPPRHDDDAASLVSSDGYEDDGFVVFDGSQEAISDVAG